ncbi:MAG: cation diffusion facilitator family transporter [Nevskia sp.]|nr:cation diffusion facilitator family transporter [Nevskia sp.]
MSKESHQGHEHAKTSNENRLWWAFGLTGSYLVVQVIGGLLTHSLALLSDAAHMLTDVVGIGIAIVAVRIARRPADSQRTFGYHRFEILAAAANAVILFLVAIYIFYEAIQRFQQPEAINTWGMLAVAAVGLIVNVIGLKLLQDGSKSSLNLKGAYLEALADAVGSVGVIAGALIIRFTGWVWVDPVIAVGIGLWVLPRTWTLFKESLNVLLEGVPQGLNLDEIRQRLLAVEGVIGVHELHVWSITSGKNSLTAHLVVDESDERFRQARLDAARIMLRERFALEHTTLQVEYRNCETAAECFPSTEAGHEHGGSP